VPRICSAHFVSERRGEGRQLNTSRRLGVSPGPVTADGPVRVFTLLHDARPVLLDFGEPGGFDIAPWTDRVRLIDAKYVGTWELPAIGAVTAPTAVLIRPDGYVARVGDLTQSELVDAINTWFGSPTAT